VNRGGNKGRNRGQCQGAGKDCQNPGKDRGLRFFHKPFSLYQQAQKNPLWARN
jgi:hypothetical protein